MLKTDSTAHRQCAREQSAFNDDEGKLRSSLYAFLQHLLNISKMRNFGDALAAFKIIYNQTRKKTTLPHGD